MKRAQEAKLEAWLKQQGGAENATLASDIVKLRQQIAADQAKRERDLAIGLVTRASMFSTAVRLTHLAKERPKADLDRDAGYQQRDWVRIEGGLKQMDRRFDPKVDQQLMVYGLQRYVALPQAQRLPALDAWLAGAKTEAQLEAEGRRAVCRQQAGQRRRAHEVVRRRQQGDRRQRRQHAASSPARCSRSCRRWKTPPMLVPAR